MSNYVKVNGAYVKDYTHIVGKDGRDYLVQLEFTKDLSEAKDVPNNLIARLLMSVRKSLRLNGTEDNYLYTIDSINSLKDADDTNHKVKVKVKHPDDRYVTLDLDWLTSYMLTKGISTVQMARDFGLDGDRVYYGSKILKGKVRVTYGQMKTFVSKHPAAKNHYSVDDN